MEIIKEYILKEILLLFLSIIIIEAVIVTLFLKTSRTIYNETYKETEEKVVQKALEAAQKLEELTKNYLSKFLCDLKLIGTHSNLFNINSTMNDRNKLNNTNKKIFAATIDILGQVEELKKFSRVREKSYITIYEEEFKNNTDTTSIIKSLMDNNKHPELNYVSYYYPEINQLSYYEKANIESTMDEEEVNNIKNIINIFKSIYIKRYIIRRENTDYIRFFIINKKKMFIYPPAPYNLTQQYFFDNINFQAGCNEINNPFPLCYYNHLNTTFYSKKNYTEQNLINFMTMLIERVNLKQTFGSLCIRMRYMRNDLEPSIVCAGIDFSNIFRTYSFNNLNKYDFGMFIRFFDNVYPIININEDIYDMILNHFENNTKTHHIFIPIKDSKILTLFHFLYYNLSISVENHTDLEVDWDQIDEEYFLIKEKMLAKINEYYSRNDLTYVSFDFNKTISQKKLLKQGYEIVKDQFKMIIIPISFIIYEITKDFSELNNVIERNVDLYIFDNINKSKIK